MATPTYRQIEAFKAIMDAGRVTDAAQKLNLSQPAVSKLLANFESAVGMRLFSRSKKRLTPSAEAHALLREINRVFVGVEGVARFAGELRNLRTGVLTIASVAALGQRHVPRVIAEFLKTHDSVDIGLHLRSSHEVADWAASQKADVGISMMPVDHPAVRDEILCEVDAVCVIPIGHRLSSKPFIEPRDLAGENFISFEALWMKTSPMSAVSKPFARPAAIIAPELTPTYISRSVSRKPSNASSIACRHPTSQNAPSGPPPASASPKRP